jgi:hypothetical protein
MGNKGEKSTRAVKATVLYRDGKEREFEVESGSENIGVVASTFIETVMLMSRVHPEIGILSAEYRLVPKARRSKTKTRKKEN